MPDTGLYTVHPFDDEWTWDTQTSGSHPWVTNSIREAIEHANLVRLEYASVEGVDPEWIAGFWCSIHQEGSGREVEEMIGWVDPYGNYTEANGSKPPLDEHGGWAGPQPVDH